MDKGSDGLLTPSPSQHSTFKHAWSVQALLQKRASVTQSMEQQQAAASISEPFKRCLGPVDVLFLGLGSILGAGCFVLTGLAAHNGAG